MLRQAAGLTRIQLGEGTRLGVLALRNIELRRSLPSREQLDLLLTAPAMADLIAMCELEGVPVELAPDPGSDPSGDPSGPGN